jgi:hypothetical protein
LGAAATRGGSWARVLSMRIMKCVLFMKVIKPRAFHVCRLPPCLLVIINSRTP